MERNVASDLKESLLQILGRVPPVTPVAAPQGQPPGPAKAATDHLLANVALFFLAIFASELILGRDLGTVVASLPYLALGAVTPLAFSYLLLRRAKRASGQPSYRTIASFLIAWGSVAFLLATVLAIALLALFLPECDLSQVIAGAQCPAFFLFATFPYEPLVEEVFKGLGLLLVTFYFAKGRLPRGPADGLVLGTLIGAGFAIVENFDFIALRFGVIDTTMILARALVGLEHIAITGTIGLWLGVAKARYGQLRLSDWLVALVPGVVLHEASDGGLALVLLLQLPSFLAAGFAAVFTIYLLVLIWQLLRKSTTYVLFPSSSQLAGAVASPALTSPSAAFCQNCGSPVDSSSTFCAKCGSKLEE